MCYLDLAGSLDVVDGVESLLHRLPQSHNAMISQHQDLNIDIHVGKIAQFIWFPSATVRQGGTKSYGSFNN